MIKCVLVFQVDDLILDFLMIKFDIIILFSGIMAPGLSQTLFGILYSSAFFNPLVMIIYVWSTLGSQTR